MDFVCPSTKAHVRENQKPVKQLEYHYAILTTIVSYVGRKDQYDQLYKILKGAKLRMG